MCPMDASRRYKPRCLTQGYGKRYVMINLLHTDAGNNQVEFSDWAFGDLCRLLECADPSARVCRDAGRFARDNGGSPAEEWFRRRRMPWAERTPLPSLRVLVLVCLLFLCPARSIVRALFIAYQPLYAHGISAMTMGYSVCPCHIHMCRLAGHSYPPSPS